MIKLRMVHPKEALASLYYALVLPHLLYGIVVWGATFKTYQAKLGTLQNKAVKAVLVLSI